MATKPKRPVKRHNNFYESLAVPAGRSTALPSVTTEARNISKLLTLALAAAVIVVVLVSTGSITLVGTKEATPSGSIVISGASPSDVQLQPAENTSWYQSTRSDIQVQDGTRLQAYSDAANLQGNATSLQGNLTSQ